MDHHDETGTSASSDQADALASTDDPGYAPESGEHGGQAQPGAEESEQAGAAPESGDR
jgi:hypothetical protein